MTTKHTTDNVSKNVFNSLTEDLSDAPDTSKPSKRAERAKLVSEKRVKAQVRSILNSMGIWYCTPLGAGYGPAAHDFVCCVPVVRPNGKRHGQFVSIETKSSAGRLRPRQLATCGAIQKADGIALLVYPDDVKALHNVLHNIMHGFVPPKGA